MKYDELIGKLRDCDDYRCNDCELKDEELCNPILMEKAADAIEELQKPQWISVEERLPGTGEVVLVYGKRGGIYTAEHNRNGRWPGSFWKLNSKSHHCEPTHWRPLPEPPKEGE